MIVKLYKSGASTEEMKELFHFGEDKFGICPYQREKIRFFKIESYKEFHFLDMLELRVLGDWDTLRWHKEQ